MNIEKELKEIEIALKIADWFSAEQHVDYDYDFSLGVLFVEGRIVFSNDNILEFTESITPDRFKYRYHYMSSAGRLNFRYDNVPHHPEISTFPNHKHVGGKIVKSSVVSLKEVVEEIVNLFLMNNMDK